jgi:predicted Zn finger-like uncharacterized protein
MPIRTCCPSCGASYTLDDPLLGKKARCKHCRQYFIVSGLVTPDECDVEMIVEEEGVQAEPPTGLSPGPDAAAAPLPRKKKRRKVRDDSSLRLRLALAGVVGLLIVGGVVALGWLLWGVQRTPNLVGKWKGAVEVRGDVKEALTDANLPPVAGRFVEALTQKAADELLAITIQFNKGGQAFYSGNTKSIGIARESDGPYEVVQTDGDVLVVRMGPSSASFEARLLFRDRDSFTLTRLDKKDAPTVTFTRVKD